MLKEFTLNPFKAVSLSALLLWLLPSLLLLFYIAPLGGVLGWSFLRPEPGLQNYSRVIFDEDVIAVIIRTFRICLLVTVLTVTAAYILAYHWVFGQPRRRLMMELCIFIPFWISVLIRAFGWVIVLRTKGVANDAMMWLGFISEPLHLVRTEFSVVLGMVHFLIPFAVFPLASVMRQVNPAILLASRGMGAKQSFTFTQVFFPLTIPGILASVIIVLVFSLGFFITPAILGGGRVVLIAEYIFIQMFQTTNWGFGAALSVALLALVTLLIGMLFRIIKPERLLN
jgi:putative spermidine/putrescine transport system permease protein